jgi:hypothetical protein
LTPIWCEYCVGWFHEDDIADGLCSECRQVVKEALIDAWREGRARKVTLDPVRCTATITVMLSDGGTWTQTLTPIESVTAGLYRLDEYEAWVKKNTAHRQDHGANGGPVQ